jgi:pimeloyl-ACP methyl ester carboxylesterase
VVIPSPPGFGFSTPLSTSGWELARTTDAYAEVMTRLGYERFAVHGTDIGSGIAGRLAALYPERIIGMHLGMDRAVLGLVGVKFPLPDGLSDVEISQLKALQIESAAERGYLEMHNHRPDTIGPALTDSPVGLLAWIGEKYKSRTSGGHRAPTVGRDELLTNIALYWFTRSGASSAQFYYESEHSELAFAMAGEVPSGWVAFDTHPLIRRTMDPWNAVGHWTDHAEGGHFPAMEEPQLLADDIRGFFREVS